jgi:hypothetical protein
VALDDRHGQRRRRQQRRDVVGAVTGRPVAVPVQPVLAREQPVERVEQVVIGAGPDLDDDETGRRVRHEDREQAVARADVAQERGAGRGQVGQATRRTGPDRELARVYGKMLRRASRILPRPPMAGADS